MTTAQKLTGRVRRTDTDTLIDTLTQLPEGDAGRILFSVVADELVTRLGLDRDAVLTADRPVDHLIVVATMAA